MAAILSQQDIYNKQRNERFTQKLNELKQVDLTQPYFRVDLCDCGMDDAKFKEVVEVVLSIVQKYPLLKMEILDISGANFLTDGCKDDLIKLIKNLPETDFLTGSGINVKMEKANFEEVDAALNEAKQKIEGKGGVFLVPLTNLKKVENKV